MKIKKYGPLVAILSMLLVATGAFIMQPKAPVGSSLEMQEDGQEVYMTRCMACHMTNGEGTPGVFPPLAESEYVSGDKGRLIRMILNGLSGEIVVNEVTYSGMMPPWGGFLNDEQIADVLTYVRSNFGNDAESVTAAEVAKVRAAVSDRKDTWTIDELNQEENLGIPGSD